tara:strand:- start:247 stop:417 length:171 start_codon:yes stop_codon:yes gene_type:complete
MHLFALTASEMGLNPIILIIIAISGIAFIAGFIRSSQENEYKKLMDYYIKKPKENK